MKKVTVTVEILGSLDTLKTITSTFEGEVMPDDLCQFIDDHVGEHSKHEERH